MQPVKLIIIGAGQRGAGYAAYAGHFPEQLQIVGVAEPRDFHRKQMMDEYRIPPENAATDWTELAARDKFADGAGVSTPRLSTMSFRVAGT